jgi:hypothetical protein
LAQDDFLFAAIFAAASALIIVEALRGGYGEITGAVAVRRRGVNWHIV